MTKRSFLIATFITTAPLLTAISEEDTPIYLAASEGKEIASKEGEKIVVHGISKDSEKSASGTNYVNFEGTDFHLVTFVSDLDQFKNGEPHEVYNEKRIAVDGIITIYRGKPQIKLTSPDQIKILTEDEVFPPVKADPEKPAAPEVSEMKEIPAATAEPVEEAPRPKPPVDWKLYFK